MHFPVLYIIALLLLSVSWSCLCILRQEISVRKTYRPWVNLEYPGLRAGTVALQGVTKRLVTLYTVKQTACARKPALYRWLWNDQPVPYKCLHPLCGTVVLSPPLLFAPVCFPEVYCFLENDLCCCCNWVLLFNSLFGDTKTWKAQQVSADVNNTIFYILWNNDFYENRLSISTNNCALARQWNTSWTQPLPSLLSNSRSLNSHLYYIFSLDTSQPVHVTEGPGPPEQWTGLTDGCSENAVGEVQTCKSSYSGDCNKRIACLRLAWLN